MGADFPSSDDLFRVMRDEVLTQNARLSREAVEREGSDANVLLAGAVAVGDEVVGQMIRVEAGLYIDSASGQALDRLVFDRYGLLRKKASPALGTVRFTTTAATAAAFTIPVNALLSTADGRQFVVTAAVNFPAASTGPVPANVRSVLAGSAQQAKIGAINSIVSTISGQPTDLVVTNALATAGADDAEEDPSLRARARQFFATARRGTLAAIEQGALAVPGVRTANAFEVLDSGGRPNRVVQLVVTDAFTSVLASLVPSGPVPGSYQAQSQALAAAVFAALDDVRAAGIYVEVDVAEVVLQAIVLRLAFQAGADVDSVTAAAKSAAVNYTNELAAGEAWSPTDLLAILRTVPGLIYTGNEVESPAGLVVPSVLQAIRTTFEIVGVSTS